MIQSLEIKSEYFFFFNVTRYAGLKVIEDRLCLYNQVEDYQIEKWVMEKNGVESSWTKMHSPHSYVHINQFNEESYYRIRRFLNDKHLINYLGMFFMG